AYAEFKKGKKKRLDLQVFERNLEDNLFDLYLYLKNKTYRHGNYEEFYVNDPKRRHIHKASVEDRIVHHLLYKYLYEVFDKTFIYDSYSCRLNKGTHKGVIRLEKFARIVSGNYTRDCLALKLDIKKFFASVDHEILFELLKKKITNKDILWLLGNIIESFNSNAGEGKGIPLGNLTSQIFANIYMNELDQFVKHKLRVKYYLRYADDFIILNSDRGLLDRYTSIPVFLEENLKLELHPSKIIMRKLSWGIDFLGYIVLSRYILPRTKTKKRMIRKMILKLDENTKGRISKNSLNQTIQSYLGYLSHASAYKLSEGLRNLV
ncbi:MAG: reverse transcriptase/maturase family protein, partial [Patescibacteria group bacterium]